MSEKFFEFLWKIENFAFCIEKHGQPLCSPTFTMDPLGKNKFAIVLFPRGRISNNAIGVYISKARSNNSPDSLQIKIAFLNHKGDDTLSAGCDLKCNFQRACAAGADSFILREEVIQEKTNNFLPQGTLTVLCRIFNVNGEAGQCIARTHIGVEHRAFDWVIDEIPNLPAEMYKSMTVDSVKNSHPSLTMKLSLKPDELSDGAFRLQIIQVDSDRNNFLVCKISLINKHGSAVLCVKDEHFFNVNTGEQIWDFPLFLRKNDLIAKKELPFAIRNFNPSL